MHLCFRILLTEGVLSSIGEGVNINIVVRGRTVREAQDLIVLRLYELIQRELRAGKNMALFLKQQEQAVSPFIRDYFAKNEKNCQRSELALKPIFPEQHFWSRVGNDFPTHIEFFTKQVTPFTAPPT